MNETILDMIIKTMISDGVRKENVLNDDSCFEHIHDFIRNNWEFPMICWTHPDYPLVSIKNIQVWQNGEWIDAIRIYNNTKA